MISAEYWKKREQAHIKEQMKQDHVISKEIQKRLDYSLQEIRNQINAEFERYAGREGITFQDARKRARKMDIEAFQTKAKKYVKEKNFSDRANQELRIYNLTMRVNRLEMLKSKVGLELVAMADDLDKFYAETLSKEASDEVKRQSGILGETVSKGFDKKLEQIANGSFRSTDFSSNIWIYQKALKADLDKLLTRQFSQGRNPRVMARELRKSFDVTQFESERLMRSESAAIQTAIQKASYEEIGFDEYDLVEEPSACKHCKDITRNNPHKVKDMKVGVNAPFIHPNCRCGTSPSYDRAAFEASLAAKGL